MFDALLHDDTNGDNEQQAKTAKIVPSYAESRADILVANMGYSAKDADIQSLPRLRLAQGLTPEVLEGLASPGQWLIPGQQPQNQLSVKVLGVKRLRLLWDRNVIPAVIVCRGENDIGTGNPGGDCTKCPLAQWEDGKPPQCELRYEYLVMTDDNLPLVLSLSTRSAGKIISQLNIALRMNKEVKVVFSSQLVAKGQKRYYIPAVRFV
jgi:hypothetical protein